jgi:hypothetical protein
VSESVEELGGTPIDPNDPDRRWYEITTAASKRWSEAGRRAAGLTVQLLGDPDRAQKVRDSLRAERKMYCETILSAWRALFPNHRGEPPNEVALLLREEADERAKGEAA